jgi:hypothetical protein
MNSKNIITINKPFISLIINYQMTWLHVIINNDKLMLKE